MKQGAKNPQHSSLTSLTSIRQQIRSAINRKTNENFITVSITKAGPNLLLIHRSITKFQKSSSKIESIQPLKEFAVISRSKIPFQFDFCSFKCHKKSFRRTASINRIYRTSSLNSHLSKLLYRVVRKKD